MTNGKEESADHTDDRSSSQPSSFLVTRDIALLGGQPGWALLQGYQTASTLIESMYFAWIFPVRIPPRTVIF